MHTPIVTHTHTRVQAWLNPRDLPANERLTCAHCAQPLRFLLQVYAPLDDVAHAFHRTLYVFCCENGSCLSHAGSMRVLRAQARVGQMKGNNRHTQIFAG
jgi:hypothetical protein